MPACRLCFSSTPLGPTPLQYYHAAELPPEEQQTWFQPLGEACRWRQSAGEVHVIATGVRHARFDACMLAWASLLVSFTQRTHLLPWSSWLNATH